MPTIYLWIPLAPLLSALFVGLVGKGLSRRAVDIIAIGSVAISFVLSSFVLIDLLEGAEPYHQTVYTWLTINGIEFNVGFLIDGLSAIMMCIVTFVSLMVHIYTMGYMQGDPGYPRFFSYISLFTFAMLMLVMSNNLVQLFFGWEAVGLISYLLIGFWFKRPSATFASLKAFLINRVGDIGFLLGMGFILAYCGSLDYAHIFAVIPSLQHMMMMLIPGHPVSLVTLVCILLFMGAIGKSAQFPLHVWLPDSMEGPTPISALIHAATMVTAGIFMVARFSPLFELSDTALNFILTMGAITALFMGLLGIIQNDIKRIIAYSTLSQLGYMVVALGASAYSASIFHLMTHAFFKALLFLAAGSVIIGLHHEQDIRYMGGLRKFMPITWLTSLIASLSLIGAPFLSGFYSKDSIIEAVHASHLPAARFAYGSLLMGVLITAIYTFRMYFLVFHGEQRFRPLKETPVSLEQVQPHESPWVMTLPLILLAIPSVLIGAMTATPLLLGGFLNQVMTTSSQHGAMAHLAEVFHRPSAWFEVGIDAFFSLPFWMALLGLLLSWFFYLKRTDLPAFCQAKMGLLYKIMDKKYYMDDFYIKLIAPMGRCLGMLFWKLGDVLLIDGLIINGVARLTHLSSVLIRRIQTGYLYHYAFAMILGTILLLSWWLGGIFPVLIG